MLLVVLPLVAALCSQDGASQPSSERAALEAGLARARPDLRCAALDSLRPRVPLDVLPLVQASLADPDEQVRCTALGVLGKLESPQSLEILLADASERLVSLRGRRRERVALLRALARRGDPRALSALTEDAHADYDLHVLRTRILALARVRSRDSIDALVALGKGLPFAEQQQVMLEWRLAWSVLTGRDGGRTVADWTRWWAETRATFEVSPELPALSESDRSRWLDAWADETTR
jgi:HEAT repeat protein